jgi:hypothetical protein
MLRVGVLEALVAVIHPDIVRVWLVGPEVVHETTGVYLAFLPGKPCPYQTRFVEDLGETHRILMRSRLT